MADEVSPIQVDSTPYGVGGIQHFKEVLAGAGDTVWKVNAEGQFMGANNFTDAPFSVDYLGSLIATAANISGTLNATGGTFSGDIIIGTGTFKVKLEGSTGKLIFLNGSTVQGEFYTYQTTPYGMQINAVAGSEVKITENNDTILVCKKVSGKQTVEFYNTGRIYADESDKLRVTKSWNPDGDDLYDLGNGGNRWASIYGTQVFCTDQNATNYVTGAIIEKNLLTKSQLKVINSDMKANTTGFSLGDVLVWKGGKLQKCSKDMDKMVQAVSNERGAPIIIGAEPIRVIGKVSVGDWLVTSEKEGCARAEKNPQLGTVIAQALKGAKNGGLIKAMITKR